MDIEEAKRYAEAIRTINRYEISTPMKDSDRLLQIEGGKPKITCEISPTLLEYAGRCATYLEFIRQLGTLRFTEDGRSAKRIPGEDAKQPLRNDLLLGTTPKIYQQLGFQADPLLYTRRHALKALAPKASKGEQFRHNHGIDPKLMCQVPLLLEDPVLIYNSPNSNSRICVVLNQVDAFAVRINEHGSEPTYDLLINQGMAAVFDQNNVDYKSGVDWALSMNGDSVTGFVATCHGAWPGGVERVTDIEFRRLTDGAGFAARQDLERIDELSDEARNAELGNLFEDASKLQPSDSLAEFIRSDIQRTVEFAVSEYAHEQTFGVDDWRIEAARADVIGDEEFNRIFGVDDDDRMGLSAFTGELKDAAEHKHGDDSISRNEPEHDGR